MEREWPRALRALPVDLKAAPWYCLGQGGLLGKQSGWTPGVCGTTSKDQHRTHKRTNESPAQRGGGGSR